MAYTSSARPSRRSSRQLAFAAMLKDCTIDIERVDQDVRPEPPRAPA